MSRTNNEFRRRMFRKVGRGFWRNAHAPALAGFAESTAGETEPESTRAAASGVTPGPVPQSMTAQPEPLPEIPEIIRSALGLVTDAVNRGAWRQVMDRCRILSDAAMQEWIEQDRAATEAASKINPPEIR